MAKQAQLDAVRPALEATDAALDKVVKVLDKTDKVVDRGTDAIEAGLEVVANVVPDALDDAVHASTRGGRSVVNFFRNPKHTAITIVLLSTTAGAALGVAGYFALKKKLEFDLRKEYDLQLESEIAEVRRGYELRAKDGKFATPAGAVEALLPAEVQSTIKSYQGVVNSTLNVNMDGPPVVHAEAGLSDEQKIEALHNAGYTDAQIADVVGTPLDVAALQEKMNSGQPIEVTETTSNIFVDGNPMEEFDYQAELLKRNADEPYVITHDEFMENENGWEQPNLTYYNGDDILTDDQDIPIPDIEGIVGSENLSKFGYGSRDRNVVYVRNEKLESDYAIALSMGEFAKEVAGFSELRHSAPSRRFRSSDE